MHEIAEFGDVHGQCETAAFQAVADAIVRKVEEKKRARDEGKIDVITKSFGEVKRRAGAPNG
eukprot:8927950-Pyramimonas_sp.AAC.1